jgi:hypothetical protein
MTHNRPAAPISLPGMTRRLPTSLRAALAAGAAAGAAAAGTALITEMAVDAVERARRCRERRQDAQAKATLDPRPWGDTKLHFRNIGGGWVLVFTAPPAQPASESAGGETDEADEAAASAAPAAEPRYSWNCTGCLAPTYERPDVEPPSLELGEAAAAANEHGGVCRGVA